MLLTSALFFSQVGLTGMELSSEDLDTVHWKLASLAQMFNLVWFGIISGGSCPRRAAFPAVAAQGVLNCFAAVLWNIDRPSFIAGVFGGFFHAFFWIWLLPVMAGTASAALYTWSLPRYKTKLV
jgi:hypothetical protein